MTFASNRFFRLPGGRPPALRPLALALLASLVTLPPAEAADRDNPNQFRFNARFVLGAEAEFKTSASAFPPQSNPGPATGSTQDRLYDDGYVRVDSTGNLGGTTGFWGYQNTAQVDLAADTIAMRSTLNSPTPDIEGVSDEPSYGGELSYSRQFGVFGGAGWGIDAGIGLFLLDLEDRSSLSSRVQNITDIYALNGITPPAAPYSGTFNSLDPRIGSTPIRSSVTNLATTSGARLLETDIYTARVGPYLDIPLGSGLNLRLGGGAAVAFVRSDFTIDETTSLAGSTTSRLSGSTTDEDVQLGAYALGFLSYPISSHWEVFAGAQWFTLGDFDQAYGGREAHLDLEDLLSVDAGMAWNF